MPMNQSRLPDDWVARAIASSPFVKLSDKNYRTCPGRLSFVHAVNPITQDANGVQLATPKYEVTWLGPPGSNEQIDAVLWPDVYATCKARWPARVQANGQMLGLHLPWRDQGERINRKTGQLYGGMNPGLRSIKMSTEYKPQVVDHLGNPVVDPKRIYAGVWAVLLFNTYDYDNKQSGVGAGLNGIMLVADDTTLEGGGPDMKAAFSGVQVEARFDAAASFGAAPPPGVPGAPPPPPGAAFLPTPQTVRNPPPPVPGQAVLPPPGAPAAPAAFDMASLLS